MNFLLVLHLVNPYTNSFKSDTIPMHTMKDALDCKKRIESSYIRNEKNIIEIVSVVEK